MLKADDRNRRSTGNQRVQFKGKLALSVALALLLPQGLVASAASPVSEHARPAPMARKALLLDVAKAGARLIAVGAHGIVVISDDMGANWRQSISPVQSTLTGVSFSDETHGWAVGHGGVILRSADAGDTWARVDAPTTEDDSFLDVLALDPEHVLAVGAYGLFLKTDDSGRHWTSIPPIEEDMHINALSHGPSGALYLAGESGMLGVSRDRGETWTPISAPYEGSFYGLLELTSGTLLSYGLRGHIFRSEDGGETWTSISNSREALIMGGTESTTGAIFLVGLESSVYTSHDDGATFALTTIDSLSACAAVAEVSNHQLVLAGEGGVTTLAVARTP